MIQDFQFTIPQTVDKTFDALGLIKEYKNPGGIGYKLLTSINRAQIHHPEIANTFASFMKREEASRSFSIIDFISKVETESKKFYTYGAPEDYILVFTKVPFQSKISKYVFRNSVFGIYELIHRTRGFSLDIKEEFIGDMSGLPEYLCTSRFTFANSDKAKYLIKNARKLGLPVRVIGRVTMEPEVIIRYQDQPMLRVDREELYDSRERTAGKIEIPIEDFNEFAYGYLSVFGYHYAISTGGAATLQVGFDLPQDKLISRLLGIYRGAKTLKFPYIKQNPVRGYELGYDFSVDTKSLGGRMVYLAYPLFDSSGFPSQTSHQYLTKYLADQASKGIIFGAFPCIPSLEATIRLLEQKGLTFNFNTILSRVAKSPCSILLLSDAPVEGMFLGYTGSNT